MVLVLKERDMKLAIMGSTGSIGTQALQIIKGQTIEVVALTCGSNAKLLLDQYWQWKPKHLVVESQEAFQIVKTSLAGEPVEILQGIAGLDHIAESADYDVLLTSVVGAVGLRPTVTAVKRGKRIALANKETLVVFGELIMPLAKHYGAEIIPVDSEHSALYQALQGNDYKTIERVVLTASGGPFRGRTKDSLLGVTKVQALKHPKWQMGAKISIDSATLMNKGLEVIEAKWLFDLEADQIEVIVHPQSIIHSIVEYWDGSMIAQMGLPDMQLPIHYALHYPKRIQTNLERLDLKTLAQMTFEAPDLETFPCLALAYEALRTGGTMPCVINAANEILVARFLKDQVGFYDIPKGIERAMHHFVPTKIESLEQILDLDSQVRNFTHSIVF